jgi:hypothetical protein
LIGGGLFFRKADLQRVPGTHPPLHTKGLRQLPIHTNTLKRRGVVMELSNEDVMLLAGGRIRCRRCSARSKRTKLRCGAPAMKGKRVCATHGGKSTGLVQNRVKQTAPKQT